MSFFKRMIRLGAKTIILEHQGRTNSSIMQLYSWKYPNLKCIN